MQRQAVYLPNDPTNKAHRAVIKAIDALTQVERLRYLIYLAERRQELPFSHRFEENSETIEEIAEILTELYVEGSEPLLQQVMDSLQEAHKLLRDATS